MLLRGRVIAILLVAITPFFASFPLASSMRHAPRKADNARQDGRSRHQGTLASSARICAVYIRRQYQEWIFYVH
jgi:hypothetical protein